MIVSLDAASTDLSIALVAPDGTVLAEDSWTSALRQSAELLPRLLVLLADAGRSIGDASLVAVGTGPGSFTGLRVGMAVGKGLALSLRVPIVGIPSLPAWLEAEPDAIAAVARAGARDAYVLERGAVEPRIVDRDALSSVGPVVAAADVAAAFGLSDARRPRAAVAIANRAAARLAAGGTPDDLATLEPIYVRAPRGVTVTSEEPVRWL